MGNEKEPDKYSEQEATQRRDDALRRALNTAPNPKKSKSIQKPKKKK